MEPKRTLHSGNLVRGIQKAFYDPEKYTCFVREDILLRDGVHKIDGGYELGRLGDFRSKISYKRRSSLVRGTFYRLCQGVVSSKMGRYERGS